MIVTIHHYYSWQWHNRFHFASFVMYSPDAKFEEHHFNISRDILD